jgi:hypothetical protein
VSALELYKSDKGYYPFEPETATNSTGGGMVTDNSEAKFTVGSYLSTFLTPTYILKIPQVIDSSGNFGYSWFYYFNSKSPSATKYSCDNSNQVPEYVIAIRSSQIQNKIASLAFGDISPGIYYFNGTTWEAINTTYKCLAPIK